MDAKEDNKRQLLTGKSNYFGWIKVTKAALVRQKLFAKDACIAGKEEDAVSHILSGVTLKIANDIKNTNDPVAILD